MTETPTFWALLVISLTTAIVHTLAGPDHYLPFIVLAKSRKWSLRKTLILTFVSGIGHVASAVLLAVVFSFFGERLTIFSHDGVNQARGSLAAWLLVILGSVYMLWGFYRLYRHRSHVHPHIHADGTIHTHQHEAVEQHAHLHGDRDHRLLLGWSLFIIFVLGPCEALLPIMAAAVTVNTACLYCSTILFSVVTILTMVFAVTLGYFGLHLLTSPWVERASHVIAGALIALCGFGMIFFGW